MARETLSLLALSAVLAGAVVYLDAPAHEARDLAILSAKLEEPSIPIPIPLTGVQLIVDEPEPVRIVEAVVEESSIREEPSAARPLPESRAHHVRSIDVTALLARAKALIEVRDTGSARVLLEYAARSNGPETLPMLAETFDREKPSQWDAHGLEPDLNRAGHLQARAAVVHGDSVSGTRPPAFDAWAKLRE